MDEKTTAPATPESSACRTAAKLRGYLSPRYQSNHRMTQNPENASDCKSRDTRQHEAIVSLIRLQFQACGIV